MMSSNNNSFELEVTWEWRIINKSDYHSRTAALFELVIINSGYTYFIMLSNNFITIHIKKK